VSAFIDQHRERFGVEPICRTLDVSASAYYQRATGERSARRLRDEWLLAEIRRVHQENYECYGSRRVWKQLLREGIEVARCTVERLMSAHGIQGAKRRGKPWRTTRPDPAGQDAPDLVERDFSAPAPNRLWVADFTYLRTWEGVAFFAFVIDVFSRMIVGWQFATHMRTTLVLDALRMALGLRAPGAEVALVHHSDRGGQYRSEDYTQALDDHDVLASLGSTGDCYDNAPAESFVDSFKTELIADRVWRTHEQAELGIAQWVGWFNHRRLHSSLDDIPPVEYEQRYATANAPDRPILVDRQVPVTSPRAADGLRTRRVSTVGVDFAAHASISSEIALAAPFCPAQAATGGGQETNGNGWPLRPVVEETCSLIETTTTTSTTTKQSS
jgi:putative transposase